MSTNRLLCLAQALTLTAAGGFTTYALCVAETDLDADFTDVLLAVVIVALFACTCLVAAMLHALHRKLDDREKYAQAAAARALIAFSQGADNEDAEVFQIHQGGR